MRVIILAAGEGSRLRPLTLDKPKCLVELGGRPLIQIQIDSLRQVGISDIHIVTGFKAEKLVSLGYPTVFNPNFSSTNMVYSLMCGRKILEEKEDVIVSYGDIVFESAVVKSLLNCDAMVATVVDRKWKRLWDLRMADPLKDAETLILDPSGNILELGRRPKDYSQIQGQYIGLTKFSAGFLPRLLDVYDKLEPDRKYEGKSFRQMYMTSFLQFLINEVVPVRAAFVNGGWAEVDTIEDLGPMRHLLKRAGLLPCFIPVNFVENKYHFEFRNIFINHLKNRIK